MGINYRRKKSNLLAALYGVNCWVSASQEEMAWGTSLPWAGGKIGQHTFFSPKVKAAINTNTSDAGVLKEEKGPPLGLDLALIEIADSDPFGVSGCNIKL